MTLDGDIHIKENTKQTDDSRHLQVNVKLQRRILSFKLRNKIVKVEIINATGKMTLYRVLY